MIADSQPMDDTRPRDPAGPASAIPPFVRRLLPLAVTGLVALAAGFLPSADTRVGLFIDWAMPLVALMLALAAASIGFLVVRGFRRATTAVRAEWIVAALVALLAVVALRTLLPVTMRVQMDETMQVGASYGLWLDATPVVPSGGWLDRDGGLEPFYVVPDKRAIAYPMLLWAVHAVAGFSADNGLVANAFLGWAALLAVWAFARRFMGPGASIAALLLTASWPAVASTAASAGFELLNLAMLGVVATVLVDATRSRDDRTLLALLPWIALLTQGRYESVFPAVAALAAALPLVVASRDRVLPFAVAAVPLLFLPFAWHRALTFGHGLEQLGVTEPFAFEYFVAHSGHFWTLVTEVSDVNPLGPTILVLAALGLAAARAPRRIDAPAVAALALGFALSFGTILAYAWADLHRPETLRLGVPAFTVLALFAARGCAALARIPRGADLAVAVLGVALFAASAPAISRDYVRARTRLGPMLETGRDFLRTSLQPCRPFVATGYSIYFMLYGFSSATLHSAAGVWDDVRARAARGAVDVVIAFEPDDEYTGLGLAPEAKPEGWTYAPLAHLDVAGGGRVLLRVMDRPDAPLPEPTPACAAALDAVRAASAVESPPRRDDPHP